MRGRAIRSSFGCLMLVTAMCVCACGSSATTTTLSAAASSSGSTTSSGSGTDTGAALLNQERLAVNRGLDAIFAACSNPTSDVPLA